MGIQRTADKLGTPSIQIKGLKIWVHGRQFPKEMDYWDGNWLLVTVECSSHDAEVTVGGPIIHLSELKAWADAANKMQNTLSGEANLECMEPNLAVKLAIDKSGHIMMTVDISPDHLLQEHRFRFEIDQSYLPELVRSFRSVLDAYPVRSE